MTHSRSLLLAGSVALLTLAACGGPTTNDGGTGGGATGGGAAGGGATGGGATGGGATGGGATGGGATGGGATGGGATGGGTTGGGTASFEPMLVGAMWTYDTSEPTADGGTKTGEKIVTVEAQEPVPGKTSIMGWRLRTVVTGSQVQLTWQEETATSIVRHRDDVYALDGVTLGDFSLYTPGKLRMKTGAADTMANAMWSETFSEVNTVTGMNPTSTTRTLTWVVLNAAESVTVPAGTFTTVHVAKKNNGVTDKEYWFARGVGKVKETAINSGRVEVLRARATP